MESNILSTMSFAILLASLSHFRIPVQKFAGRERASLALSLSLSIAPMASIYSCKKCGANLNLNTVDLFPPDYYFDAGNKNTLSFARVDPSKLRFEKEDKIRPFFETLNYWGIQRNRTMIKCNNCGCVVGHVYDDGPPLMDGHGQLGFGPSQVIPRVSRYRFKTKSLFISSET